LISDADMKQIIRTVVESAIPKLVPEIVNNVLRVYLEGNIVQKSSVVFDHDQKSIKPRLHVYQGTTVKELEDIIKVAMAGETYINENWKDKPIAPLPPIVKPTPEEKQNGNKRES
jgi:hypothetical protein